MSSAAGVASGGDDATSRSGGSAATERIANRNKLDRPATHSPAPADETENLGGTAAAADVRLSSSAWVQEEKEVRYEEGASELFMLVEDARWDEVCDR